MGGQKIKETCSDNEGQVRDNWLEIIADHDWNKESKQGTTLFSPTALNDHSKVMQIGKIKIPENNLQKKLNDFFKSTN